MNFNRVILTLLIGLFFTGRVAAQGLPKESDAPALRLPAINGDTISLTDFKGQLVLVDFWGSWCYPCRMANRTQRNLYSKYHALGFEIVSVSLDKDVNAWKRAVAIDSMYWPQLQQKTAWASATAKDWGIQKLPCCYLINRDGKVLAVNPNYGVIEAWLKELLPINQSL